MENAGFQLRCIDVRDRAAELLRLNHGHNSPYKDGSPGHNWFHGFVKRHPGFLLYHLHLQILVSCSRNDQCRFVCRTGVQENREAKHRSEHFQTKAHVAKILRHRCKREWPQPFSSLIGPPFHPRSLFSSFSLPVSPGATVVCALLFKNSSFVNMNRELLYWLNCCKIFD